MIKERTILSFSILYVLCTSTFFVWLLLNHLTLTSYEPIFFNNKLDLTGNYILLSGFHLKVIAHQWLRVLMDFLFVGLPAILLFTVWKRSKYTRLVAMFTAVYNLCYAWLYSLLGVISIEVFTAWIYMPLIFIYTDKKGFFNMALVLRLVFLVIFFSTALWKFRAGGFFNADQMSAILFRQHTAMLAYAPDHFFSNIIRYLIERPLLSQSLYHLATILEVSMFIGFFTRKYDRMLLVFALIFILFDYWLMEINYFSWLPMLFVLYITHQKKEMARVPL